MCHNIVFIPSSSAHSLPHVVLAPPCYTLTQAREIVEEEIRKLPAGQVPPDVQVERLEIALGRRGFVWPSFTVAGEEVAS